MPSTADSLNILAEFQDEKLEVDFIGSNITGSRVFLHRVILASGLVYLAWFLFDFIHYDDPGILIFSIINRLVVLAIAIAAKIIITNTREYKTMMLSLTVFEAVLICSFLLLMINQSMLGFYGQSMILMALISINFALPNRWINSLILSTMGILFFIIISISNLTPGAPIALFESVVCICLVTWVSAYTGRRWNISRRMHYLKDEQLAAMLETDKLTGIYHRQKFDRILSLRSHIAKSTSGSFALIMIDIDNFKEINDRFGPLVGDRVLSECADILVKSVRDRDTVARWSGEEYMIMTPNLTLESAVAFSERLRSIIEDMVFEDEIHITASFGVDIFWDNDSKESLLTRVEEFARKAKQAGGNRIHAGKLKKS